MSTETIGGGRGWIRSGSTRDVVRSPEPEIKPSRHSVKQTRGPVSRTGPTPPAVHRPLSARVARVVKKSNNPALQTVKTLHESKDFQTLYRRENGKAFDGGMIIAAWEATQREDGAKLPRGEVVSIEAAVGGLDELITNLRRVDQAAPVVADVIQLCMDLKAALQRPRTPAQDPVRQPPRREEQQRVQRRGPQDVLLPEDLGELEVTEANRSRSEESSDPRLDRRERKNRRDRRQDPARGLEQKWIDVPQRGSEPQRDSAVGSEDSDEADSAAEESEDSVVGGGAEATAETAIPDPPIRPDPSHGDPVPGAPVKRYDVRIWDIPEAADPGPQPFVPARPGISPPPTELPPAVPVAAPDPLSSVADAHETDETAIPDPPIRPDPSHGDPVPGAPVKRYDVRIWDIPEAADPGPQPFVPARPGISPPPTELPPAVPVAAPDPLSSVADAHETDETVIPDQATRPDPSHGDPVPGAPVKRYEVLIEDILPEAVDPQPQPFVPARPGISPPPTELPPALPVAAPDPLSSVADARVQKLIKQKIAREQCLTQESEADLAARIVARLKAHGLDGQLTGDQQLEAAKKLIARAPKVLDENAVAAPEVRRRLQAFRDTYGSAAATKALHALDAKDLLHRRVWLGQRQQVAEAMRTLDDAAAAERKSADQKLTFKLTEFAAIRRQPGKSTSGWFDDLAEFGINPGMLISEAFDLSTVSPFKPKSLTPLNENDRLALEGLSEVRTQRRTVDALLGNEEAQAIWNDPKWWDVGAAPPPMTEIYAATAQLPTRLGMLAQDFVKARSRGADGAPTISAAQHLTGVRAAQEFVVWSAKNLRKIEAYIACLTAIRQESEKATPNSRETAKSIEDLIASLQKIKQALTANTGVFADMFDLARSTLARNQQRRDVIAGLSVRTALSLTEEQKALLGPEASSELFAEAQQLAQGPYRQDNIEAQSKAWAPIRDRIIDKYVGGPRAPLDAPVPPAPIQDARAS